MNATIRKQQLDLDGAPVVDIRRSLMLRDDPTSKGNANVYSLDLAVSILRSTMIAIVSDWSSH